jgi:hypothetical protein
VNSSVAILLHLDSFALGPAARFAHVASQFFLAGGGGRDKMFRGIGPPVCGDPVMSSAHVRSLDALVDLKAAFCTFAAEAKEAFSSLNMSIRRFEDWLNEQVKHWTATIRECEDAVFQAKQDLARRRMLVGG